MDRTDLKDKAQDQAQDTPALGRAELSLTVRTAVSEVLGTEVDDIDETTDLGNDFGIDSLELMDVGARLENALRVKIQVSDLLEARTVGDAVDLLERRMERPV
ncbi:acyl carrier protein [Streptomyces sp. NBC_01288]|uniref:acyl carrier protein n=1 Tax=Streptomyces sp. NBC_01288 TaxID=2903814 RepID=UPI002E15FEFF|nr:acyl carrier protein [Streptomyces sp. NBC_01288]